MDLSKELIRTSNLIKVVEDSMQDETFLPENIVFQRSDPHTITISKKNTTPPLNGQQCYLYNAAPTLGVRYVEALRSIMCMVKILFKLQDGDQRTNLIAASITMLYSHISYDMFMDVIGPHLYECVRECVLYSDEMLANGKHPADRLIEVIEELFNSETSKPEESTESST